MAGTSIATVSRVINGADCVSERTKKRVRDAVETLGYVPNPVGRMLKTGGNKSIALIMPRRLSSFYADLVESMTREAMEHDYTLLMCAGNDDEKYEREIIDRLLTNVVSGFIFTGSSFDSHELSELNKKMPSVLCCEPVDRSELFTVAADYEGGVKNVVRELAAAGHKRIGYISMRHKPVSSRLKQKGFHEALAEAGLEDNDEYCFYGPHSAKTGHSAMRYFRCLDEPPTAVFAETDNLAVGALNYAGENGIKVGEELSIVGFDDIEICNMVTPKLTSVHQQLDEIGRIAVKTLIDIIENGKENVGTLTVPTELIKRESFR